MDTNSIHVRLATIADAEILAKLGAETWIKTYITDRYTEGVQAYTNTIFYTEQLKKHLAAAHSIFLIVEIDAMAVGFAQMQDGAFFKSISGPDPLELERFYIKTTWTGKGVALYLMLACLSYAREHGFKTVCVTDWEFTRHAQPFYYFWHRTEAGMYYVSLEKNQPIRKNVVSAAQS